MIYADLNEEQQKYITNGYIWTPSMEYIEFCDWNKFPTRSDDVYSLFQEIESRYIEVMYENQ